MNRIQRICRCLAGLTSRVGVLLAYGVAVPAALVTGRPEPPGWNKHPPLPARSHPVVTGGMPGWQITLIAAALLSAVLAVIVYRMRAARRRVTASAA